MALTSAPSPAEHARQVIARTALVWQIAAPSARAVARRAPYGDVPLRVVRRVHAATAGEPGAGGWCATWRPLSQDVARS